MTTTKIRKLELASANLPWKPLSFRVPTNPAIHRRGTVVPEPALNPRVVEAAYDRFHEWPPVVATLGQGRVMAKLREFARTISRAREREQEFFISVRRMAKLANCHHATAARRANRLVDLKVWELVTPGATKFQHAATYRISRDFLANNPPNSENATEL